MNRIPVLMALAAILALPCAARGQDQPAAAPAQPGVKNQFNDPAMSFTAPADYYQVPLAPHAPVGFQDAAVVAGWVKNPGKQEQHTITITMQDFDANLEGFEMITENDLRTQIDGVFFKKKERTTLSNGMPAFWQEISVGSGFAEVKRFQYVWVDGVRGVTLAIWAQFGELDETTAKRDLANASGVAFPKNRP